MRTRRPAHIELAAAEAAETIMPLLTEFELEDQKRLVKLAYNILFGEDEEKKPDSAEGFAGKIKKAIDDGLGKEKVDPQLVRVALEWMQEQEGKEYLSDITVNIVPYTVPDIALERIVAEADEEIVARVEAAIMVRKAGGPPKRPHGRPRKTLKR